MSATSTPRSKSQRTPPAPPSPPPSARTDRELLAAAHAKGPGATLWTWIGLSGPGWLQSAITLGGGSLSTSLFLGGVAGFSMLWVQPLAMILGIIMLSAIAYIATSTGEKPFGQILRHINPVLAWGWLLGALAANMVWSLPQYALAVGAIKDNLLPIDMLPESLRPISDTDMEKWWKVGLTSLIFVICLAITWSYESGRTGIKIYEAILKLMVAGVIICFFGVGIALSTSGQIDWSAVVAGFVPNFTALFRPAPAFADLLAAVPVDHRAYWASTIVAQQRDFILGAAATAVGINMTFLFPYSLLKKKWTREFRGLVVFDLATGMLIPFTLATSFVIMAAASQFHPTPGRVVLREGATVSAKSLSDHQVAMTKRGFVFDNEAKFTQPELALAWHLEKRNSQQLSQSLAPLVGNRVAYVVFGIGVLGMALSTITLLMLISGFCFCEAFGLPSEGWPHRLGCLLSATGVLGPFLGLSDAYVAVPTSLFGAMLIPIAYLTFMLMMNSKTILGADRPRGLSRWVWNVLMAVATAAALTGSFAAFWSKLEWWSLLVFAGFGILIVLGTFLRPKPGPRFPSTSAPDADIADRTVPT